MLANQILYSGGYGAMTGEKLLEPHLLWRSKWGDVVPET